MENNGTKRSTSLSRSHPPSRPTTPLRPSSRISLRDSQGFSTGDSSTSFPLDSLEPAFAELSDSMADLEANFMHLQLMHESLSRFNESFASFLYGLNMNAFCVDFPEVRWEGFQMFSCHSLCCSRRQYQSRLNEPHGMKRHLVDIQYTGHGF